MNSIELIIEIRKLAEKAQQNNLRNEARTLFATELVLRQQVLQQGEKPEPWASEKELQSFVTDRVIHTQPQAV